MPVFNDFDFQIALARRRGANFADILGNRSFATSVFRTYLCELSKRQNYGKTQHFAQFLPAKTSLLSNIDAARATGNFQYSRKLELLNFLWLYTHVFLCVYRCIVATMYSRDSKAAVVINWCWGRILYTSHSQWNGIDPFTKEAMSKCGTQQGLLLMFVKELYFIWLLGEIWANGQGQAPPNCWIWSPTVWARRAKRTMKDGKGGEKGEKGKGFETWSMKE